MRRLPRLAARGMRGALALLACLTVAGCGDSGLTRASAEERVSDHPGRLVALPDGRRLNLRCAGRGSPTIILESGWGASSSAWVKVQPALARRTHVCSYDRAGNGFSDPGPEPRDGAAIARDLDQALRAARIHGPFILVGHSAGALYGRLFAARRRGEMAGLVLLDPTIARRPVSAGADDGMGGPRARLRRCLAASETSPQPPSGNEAWAGCLPPRMSGAALDAARRPEAWRNQLSELDNIFTRTSLEADRIGDLLKDIPAYVITASQTAATSRKVGEDPPISLWELQHQRLAESSLHGSQRTVRSAHLVMIDRPEVVIDAVTAMVVAARAGWPPPPLGPSEMAAAPDGAPVLGASARPNSH